jgi:lipopolysaccharide export system protein LptA
MKALAVLLLTSASLMAAETNLFPERPGLSITSDFAEFRLKGGTFYDSNNVVVTDPPAQPGELPTVLRCRELTATRDALGKFDSIVALHGVRIQQGADEARGHQAVYTRSNEWMVLTGPFDPADTNSPRPYLLRGQDTIEAERFIYDRISNTLRFDRGKTVISPATMSKGNTNAAGTNRPGSSRRPFPFPTSPAK